MSSRRHDIDALRALAFTLVILYHVGMYYVADWSWHLKSPHAAEWLHWPMRALNLWRMDLVFLTSGLSLALLAAQHRAGLFGRRSWRLLLPLAFGMAVVVPYQPYAQMVANGVITPGFGDFLLRYVRGGPWPRGAFEGWEVGVTWNHLWYLVYLWVYTAALLALGPLLRSATGVRCMEAFRRLRGRALLLLPVVPLWLGSASLWPHFPPTHDLVRDAWLHSVYFTLFLYGYAIGTDPGWWREARRLRRPALCLALLALAATLALRAHLPPSGADAMRLATRLLADVYVWWMLVALLGWAHHALDRPWPGLAWANEQVYPWYVLHQTVLIVLIVQVAPWKLGPVLEPLLLVAGTAAGCWGLTAVVRRSRWLRPLFGLKPRPAPPRCPSPAQPASPAGGSA